MHVTSFSIFFVFCFVLFVTYLVDLILERVLLANSLSSMQAVDPGLIPEQYQYTIIEVAINVFLLHFGGSFPSTNINLWNSIGFEGWRTNLLNFSPPYRWSTCRYLITCFFLHTLWPLSMCIHFHTFLGSFILESQLIHILWCTVCLDVNKHSYRVIILIHVGFVLWWSTL